MATDIEPSLGHGALFTQAGVTLGYDAIDLRRFLAIDRQEGPIDFGSYKVSQRGTGPNMSVDIAANSGAGALIAGDSVSQQGLYMIPPHSGVINEVIAAADGTNPRNDLVVLELLDDTHAAGGLNKGRTRIITGTPNASAAKDDAYGVNGTPTVPVSAIPLAVYNVPAADTTIADAQISERRPGVPSAITAEESRTNVAYGLMPTPDLVCGVIVPEGGHLSVRFQSLWKESGNGTASAAIFLNANQIKTQVPGTSTPQVQEALCPGAAGIYVPLVTSYPGLYGVVDTVPTASGSDVTTGQVIAYGDDAGGESLIAVAPGTYDVSVRYKASSGSVTVKERKLWACGLRR